MCVYICMHVCMNVCMYVCMHVGKLCILYMYVCMCVCMYVCVYVCIYIYIHIAYIYITLLCDKVARRRQVWSMVNDQVATGSTPCSERPLGYGKLVMHTVPLSPSSINRIMCKMERWWEFLPGVGSFVSST